MTEVTQADRVAAAGFAAADNEYWLANALDGHRLNQAMANHRIASTATLQAENDRLKARVAELEGMLDRALYLNMKFPVARYLMANTHGRLDGVEKARRHLELSTIACSVLAGNSVGDDEPDFVLVMKVHDATQALTSYMDTQIGFPIYERPDYDSLSPLFFKRFMELARAALKDTNHREGI